MKILSIDVGIKNLALCILETTDSHNNLNNHNIDFNTLNFIIRYWDVINLFEEQIKICQFNIVNKKKHKQCTKKAKFHKNGCFFCKAHAAKSKYKLPTSDLNKYKRMKNDELIQLTNDFDISLSVPTNKKNLINCIEMFREKYVFENVSNMKCNEISIINIGIAIKDNLEKLDTFIFSNIDLILIENQISPIANRMNCIQGMLTQYFIMKNMNKIIYVSAANKLKIFIGNKRTTYSERKKISVDITRKLLSFNNDNNINKDKIINMFNKHKKKDDLADCFLQGLWYYGKEFDILSDIYTKAMH